MTKMKPILVTGAHRTGTTWVGKVLDASPTHAYVSEPMHANHSWGVMAAHVPHWYTYIYPENEGPFRRAFQDTLRFNYRTVSAMKHARSWKDVMKMGRDQLNFWVAGILNQQPVLKDPFAVFSAPWFHHRFDFQVVITVRHPLGFVSSLKRLGWTFDFRNLLRQSALMEDHLDKFRGEMEEMLHLSGDVIGQGILLWKAIYAVVANYGREYASFYLARHEDLSLQPFQGFRDLFKSLDLPYTKKVRRKIESTTRAKNPGQLPPGEEHAVQLNSRANINNWKKRLTPAEVDRILNETEDDLYGFYERDEWRTW